MSLIYRSVGLLSGKSDLQESVLLIKEVEEEPAEAYISDREDHIAPCFRYKVYDALEEVSVDAAEGEDLLSHIDGDRVEADNSEEQCPFLPSSYVDDIVEECKHSYAV